MIVTFCGHSDFSELERCRPILLSLFEKKIGDAPVDFYLGGYGNFDTFANSCCKEYQATHPQVRRIFVTPYLTPEYQRGYLNEIAAQYDSIAYFPIENVPPRFAISHRNRQMIERADWVVAYVTRSYGGAYRSYQRAKKSNKPIDNLANEQ